MTNCCAPLHRSRSRNLACTASKLSLRPVVKANTARCTKDVHKGLLRSTAPFSTERCRTMVSQGPRALSQKTLLAIAGTLITIAGTLVPSRAIMCIVTGNPVLQPQGICRVPATLGTFVLSRAIFSRVSQESRCTTARRVAFRLWGPLPSCMGLAVQSYVKSQLTHMRTRASVHAHTCCGVLVRDVSM